LSDDTEYLEGKTCPACGSNERYERVRNVMVCRNDCHSYHTITQAERFVGLGIIVERDNHSTKLIFLDRQSPYRVSKKPLSDEDCLAIASYHESFGLGSSDNVLAPIGKKLPQIRTWYNCHKEYLRQRNASGFYRRVRYHIDALQDDVDWFTTDGFTITRDFYSEVSLIENNSEHLGSLPQLLPNQDCLNLLASKEVRDQFEERATAMAASSIRRHLLEDDPPYHDVLNLYYPIEKGRKAFLDSLEGESLQAFKRYVTANLRWLKEIREWCKDHPNLLRTIDLLNLYS
jgi:hypothetical protein